MTVLGTESKHREINKPSMLLSQEENKTVLALIGSRCQTLATTVAQVYRSEGPSHNYRWNKRTCGVVCFVKDNLRRSYFIRVYDMDRMVLVFDQEPRLLAYAIEGNTPLLVVRPTLEEWGHRLRRQEQMGPASRTEYKLQHRQAGI